MVLLHNGIPANGHQRGRISQAAHDSQFIQTGWTLLLSHCDSHLWPHTVQLGSETQCWPLTCDGTSVLSAATQTSWHAVVPWPAPSQIPGGPHSFVLKGLPRPEQELQAAHSQVPVPSHHHPPRTSAFSVWHVPSHRAAELPSWFPAWAALPTCTRCLSFH